MKPNKPVRIQQNIKAELLAFFNNNKKELLILSGIYLLIAILLKYFYPYTDLTSDTGGYINWASGGFKHGGPRPLGYSYVLYFLQQFANNTTIIFIVQYLLHCIAVLFFTYTILHIGNITNRYIRYSFLLMSVAYLPAIYMTNMIMSDSLFTSLTILLFTLSVWLYYKKNIYLIIPIVALMFFIISIRYIGLVYPAFVIPVCLFFFRKKFTGVILSGILLLTIYGYVEKVKSGTEKDQGVRQFSAFGGWQLANNALHVVPHLDIDNPLIETNDYNLLGIDTMIRLTYDRNPNLYPHKDTVTYLFIWDKTSPLNMYLEYYALHNRSKKYYKMWNEVGALYADYGSELVKTYPGKFFRYYLLNNAKNMVRPNIGFFKSFSDSTYFVNRLWFGWKDDMDIQPRKDILRPALLITPFVYTFYWIIFAAAAVYLGLAIGKKKMAQPQVVLTVLMVGFVLLYSAASIYAAPVNLRFLLPIRMMMLGTVFIALQHYTSKKPVTHS